MRCGNGAFLQGVLLITIASATILLLFPAELEDDFLIIVKLAMGIWIIRSVFALFGHRL